MGTILVLFTLALVAGVAASAIGAVFSMWALDVLHNYVPEVPELGFIPVWMILFLLSSVGNALKGTDVNAKT